MSENTINKHWFNAVLHDRGMSQRELCRRLGLDSSAISLTLRGKRQMKMTEAVDIARLLGVPLSDVLQNAGLKIDSTGMRQAAVVGYIDGQLEAHIDWNAKGDRVGIPSDLPEDAVALISKSTGGPSDMLDGWTFYIAPPAPPTSDMLGRYCIVGLQDGVTLMRFVRRGYQPGTYNLATMVGVSVENALVEWAAPVLMIKPN